MDQSGKTPPERREALARELVEFLNLGRNTRRVFPDREDVPAELRMSEELSQVVTEHVRALGDQSAAIAHIYADYWTEAELIELLAFYRSALGARFLAFHPVLAAEMGKLTAARYRANAADIEAIMRRAQRAPDTPGT